MNKVILIGRLVKDVELRNTSNGTAVAKFTLAVDRPYTNQNGEKEADFINILVWRKLAEFCEKYLKKGNKVALEGLIQTRNYEDKEGKKHYITEVVAENVQFLETKKKEQKEDKHSNIPYEEMRQEISPDLPF